MLPEDIARCVLYKIVNLHHATKSCRLRVGISFLCVFNCNGNPPGCGDRLGDVGSSQQVGNWSSSELAGVRCSSGPGGKLPGCSDWLGNVGSSRSVGSWPSSELACVMCSSGPQGCSSGGIRSHYRIWARCGLSPNIVGRSTLLRYIHLSSGFSFKISCLVARIYGRDQYNELSGKHCKNSKSVPTRLPERKISLHPAASKVYDWPRSRNMFKPNCSTYHRLVGIGKHTHI